MKHSSSLSMPPCSSIPRSPSMFGVGGLHRVPASFSSIPPSRMKKHAPSPSDETDAYSPSTASFYRRRFVDNLRGRKEQSSSSSEGLDDNGHPIRTPGQEGGGGAAWRRGPPAHGSSLVHDFDEFRTNMLVKHELNADSIGPNVLILQDFLSNNTRKAAAFFSLSYSRDFLQAVHQHKHAVQPRMAFAMLCSLASIAPLLFADPLQRHNTAAAETIHDIISALAQTAEVDLTNMAIHSLSTICEGLSLLKVNFPTLMHPLCHVIKQKPPMSSAHSLSFCSALHLARHMDDEALSILLQHQREHPIDPLRPFPSLLRTLNLLSYARFNDSVQEAIEFLAADMGNHAHLMRDATIKNAAGILASTPSSSPAVMGALQVLLVRVTDGKAGRDPQTASFILSAMHSKGASLTEGAAAVSPSERRVFMVNPTVATEPPAEKELPRALRIEAKNISKGVGRAFAKADAVPPGLHGQTQRMETLRLEREARREPKSARQEEIKAEATRLLAVSAHAREEARFQSYQQQAVDTLISLAEIVRDAARQNGAEESKIDQWAHDLHRCASIPLPAGRTLPLPNQEWLETVATTLHSWGYARGVRNVMCMAKRVGLTLNLPLQENGEPYVAAPEPIAGLPIYQQRSLQQRAERMRMPHEPSVLPSFAQLCETSVADLQRLCVELMIESKGKRDVLMERINSYYIAQFTAELPTFAVSETVTMPIVPPKRPRSKKTKAKVDQETSSEVEEKAPAGAGLTTTTDTTSSSVAVTTPTTTSASSPEAGAVNVAADETPKNDATPTAASAAADPAAATAGHP